VLCHGGSNSFLAGLKPLEISNAHGMFVNLWYLLPAGFADLSRIVQPGFRSLATAWVTPTALILGGGLFSAALRYMGQNYTFGLGISLAALIIIIGLLLAIFLELIENLEEGC
jgi:hypothetical protein